jgi:anti-sigma factor RsiW
VTSREEIELACRELVELVTDYLDGALAPEVTDAVEQHLRECDACAEYLRQIEATIAVTGHLPVTPLSDRVRDEILAAYRAIHRR